MEMNFVMLLVAAIVPMITGFIWYNPKVFGTAWMKAAEMTEEKMKGANMGLTFGLSYLLSIFLAMAIQFTVIHQFHVGSLLMGDPSFMEAGSELNTWFKTFMAEHGTDFRTFKHGLLHGVIDGFFFATPILATNALFERKGFKYIAVNAGYWIVTIGLMGGVLCQWV